MPMMDIHIYKPPTQTVQIHLQISAADSYEFGRSTVLRLLISFFLFLKFSLPSLGDERGPQHTEEGEAGASVQAQGEHAALPGRGGGPPPGPAAGLLRPELPLLQAQGHDQEARLGAGADPRGADVFLKSVKCHSKFDEPYKSSVSVFEFKVKLLFVT